MDVMERMQDELIDVLARAKRVMVFTGAGASKESGLPTFREIDGEWTRHDPMTFATLEGFTRASGGGLEPLPHAPAPDLRGPAQPRPRRNRPNGAALRLPPCKGGARRGDFLLVTQNVDDLHERAGSRKLVKIHGDCWGMRCLECSSVYDTRDFDFPPEFTSDTLPTCPQCNKLCRPNIVWFGEYVPHEAMMAAADAAADCDLMLIVGTSGEVSAGYGFAERAVSNGAIIVEVNPSEGHLTHHADFWIAEPAGKALPRLWCAVESRCSR